MVIVEVVAPDSHSYWQTYYWGVVAAELAGWVKPCSFHQTCCYSEQATTSIEVLAVVDS